MLQLKNFQPLRPHLFAMAPERRAFLKQCAAAAVTLAATTRATGQTPPGVRSLQLGFIWHDA